MRYYLLIFLCLTNFQLSYTNMMKDMALMMGAQIGASQANQDITEEFQNTSKAIQDEQKTLNNATNNFITSISTAQTNLLNNVSSVFASAGQQVSSIANKQQQAVQSLQNYIQSVTSLDKPEINYLDQPVSYDQLFTNGTMYTPRGPVWKNVFQIGDWEYDQTTQSFWQYQAIPFLNQTIDNAFKNSIFTEWQTQQPYEISCEITLYKVFYPFFVGIIFNKTRWISGDTYGLQKYRTLGIYGDSNKKISLCFAEESITSQDKKTVTPVTPLEQIYNNQGIQNFTINQNAFTSLETSPVTFHIKIKPSNNSIMYKIWGSESKEPSTYTKITIAHSSQKLNKSSSTPYLANNFNDIYLYHGIGFLSPGAIAQFNLKTPTSVIFSAKTIAEFSEEISNNFNNQKYTSASQTLLKSTAGD